MSSMRKFTLVSYDNEKFLVDEPVARMIQTVSNIVDDISDEHVTYIPLEVTSYILKKVIEYCKAHSGVVYEELKPSADGSRFWTGDFVNVDITTLLDLRKAANYLHIQSLLDLTCLVLSKKIMGKSPQALKSEYTSEEIDEMLMPYESDYNKGQF